MVIGEKAFLIISLLVCLALVVFGVGVFLAWVIGGMYVSGELFTRSFLGVSIGGIGLFVLIELWYLWVD